MVTYPNLELRKFLAPEFIFGSGARHSVGQYALHYNARKILLVTDPGVIAAGWAQEATANLEAVGLPYVIYSNVTANPRAQEVMDGAVIYQKEACDVIVAVGGGSPIDCAKGIGLVSSNKQHILSFEGVDQVRKPMPPLICIPTTGGTSADVSQFAIISNPNERVKIAIVSKAVVPDVALVDPATLTTMDPFLTACTGLDALVHAIEAFVSTGSSHITDVHALQAIQYISSNLLSSIKNPEDINLRGKIMMGSLEAGLAFSNASLGGVHAMAHSLGGLFDLPHGECNSMLFRHVVEYNFQEAAEKYCHIGMAMGIDLRGMTTKNKKAAILKEIERLKQAAGIKKTLGEKGVQKNDVPGLAQKAMQDPCIATNPRRPNKRDLEVIYEEAI
jgi:alcohol dehydrogenase